MLQHTHQHTFTPTHNPRPVAVVQAEEEAARCWKRLDEHLETRNGEHYETEWWIELQRLQAAANAAAEWLTDLRMAALNDCTCSHDANREGMLCLVCRAMQPQEMEF